MEDLNWKMLIVPVLILFVFIGGIIGIVNWQKSKQAPTVSALTVNLPEGEVQSAEKELNVSGKVEKGNKVYINDEEAKVEKDGSYTKIITLNEGVNKIVVKEKKKGKDVATIERTVKYTAQAPQKPVVNPEVPAVPQSSAPAVVSPQVPADLATSGPEEIIIPVVGAGGIVFAILFYRKSKKQLTATLRR